MGCIRYCLTEGQKPHACNEPKGSQLDEYLPFELLVEWSQNTLRNLTR